MGNYKTLNLHYRDDYQEIIVSFNVAYENKFYKLAITAKNKVLSWVIQTLSVILERD